MKLFVQWYLKMLVKIIIARHRPEVIGITGSTNKTVVKKQVANVLRTRFTVLENFRSYNTEIGLPLAVLEMPSGNRSIAAWVAVLMRGTIKALFGTQFPQKLVIEYGVDAPGKMDYLLSIVRPTVVIVTDVEPVYQESFGSVDALAREYAKLVAATPPKGTVILNFDNEHVRILSRVSVAPVVFVSAVSPQDDLSVTSEHDTAKTSLVITVASKQYPYILQSRGQHFVLAILCAVRIAQFYSIETETAIAALNNSL